MAVLRQSGHVLPQLDYICRHLDRYIPMLAKATHPRQKAKLGQVMRWAGVKNTSAPLNILLRAASKNIHSNSYHHPWHTMTVMILSAMLGRRAHIGQDEMDELMTLALIHDLDHRGKMASPIIYQEEERSAKIASSRLFGRYSGHYFGRAGQQHDLRSALRATAFGAKDHQINDDVTALLVDADILASLIFPYDDVIKLTKGLKKEKGATTPSEATLQAFLKAAGKRGLQHETTRALAGVLKARYMTVFHDPDAARRLGFAEKGA